MAKIVITSSYNQINIVFNDESVNTYREKGVWDKKNVHIDLSQGSANIVLTVEHESQWTFTFDGNGGNKVDSVDGVTPTSNSNLYDLLTRALKVNPERVISTEFSDPDFTTLVTSVNTYKSTSTKEFIDEVYMVSAATLSLVNTFYCVLIEYN